MQQRSNTAVNTRVLHDLDLSNIYSDTAKRQQVATTSPSKKKKQKGKKLPPLFLYSLSLLVAEKHSGLTCEGLERVNESRAKSRTDRGPAQFGRTCPRPGRTLPEVTTWPIARGCTGCTALGGTWHSADPGPRETDPSQHWVKIHNWVSDPPQPKMWFAVITGLLTYFFLR